jgi:hypothetical protein
MQLLTFNTAQADDCWRSSAPIAETSTMWNATLQFQDVNAHAYKERYTTNYGFDLALLFT